MPKEVNKIAKNMLK